MNIERLKRNVKDVSVCISTGAYIGTMCGLAIVDNPIGYCMSILLVIFLIICAILFGKE